MSRLFKLLFSLKNPSLVMVFDSEMVDSVIKASGKDIKIYQMESLIKGNALKLLKSETVIVQADIEQETEKIEFLVKESLSVIFVVPDDFNNNQIKEIKRLTKRKIFNSTLIVENQSVFKFQPSAISLLSVGFEKKSDVCVSDLNIDDNTNFKINNKGNIVPFWFNEKLKKKEIISIVLAVTVVMTLGLNLVQISQNLKKDCKIPLNQ
jgi:hypothetical protein